MDRWAKRYQNIILYLSNFIIFIGFLGMAFIIFELFRSLYKLITSPEALPGVGLIQPFFPDIPGTIFVPFFYFIISIFVIAVVHEFSHGLVARAYKCRVKSSGFAFLGIILPIIPAAFVEPDEKQLSKRPAKQQLALFAAGPFANILLGVIIIGVFAFGVSPLSNVMMEVEGIELVSIVNKTNQTFPAQAAGLTAGDLILEMDNVKMESADNFSQVIDNHKPGDVIEVVTNKTAYTLVFAEHPEKEGEAYMGVTAAPKTEVRPSFIEK